MSNILYREVNGHIEFRRHDTSMSTLSIFIPPPLQYPIKRDPSLSLDEDAMRHCIKAGWSSRCFNADTYPGKAFLAKRDWNSHK